MQGFDLLAVLSNADYRALFEHGLEMTFAIFVGSWLLGMIVAVLLLAFRMARSRVAETVVTAYISYHRNVPTLVQLML
jgi:polar amino acid transport system permease protein